MFKKLLQLVLVMSIVFSGMFAYSTLASNNGNNSWDRKPDKKFDSRLEKILDQGFIRVGTTGDYKPFTYYNPETQQYEGYDIEAAKLLANELGVEVKFVKTSWPTLMEDLLADKFDIAMGGITRRMSRQVQAQFSDGYIPFGKSPLIRAEDKDRFTSLEDIDQPDVKIGVNPGGTNEEFVRENIKNAQIIVYQNNLEIPEKVASGEVDVMITDSIEAIDYAKSNENLYAALTDNPWDKSQFGYLMQHGDAKFTNTINFWMEEMELKGEFSKLREEWIY
ncbi:transporter substrate-binding domain-containing protein [Bacillus litorisediminis]|uniref:transporter substrate-binding domain-containing protein n=1 Tax=Bacillus litorisediminis TaxID=2922713 RepID=UPI001FAD6317|nr:transporter substrate-binding domain-containing protein [Bacillus litorisediminis]